MTAQEAGVALLPEALPPRRAAAKDAALKWLNANISEFFPPQSLSGESGSSPLRDFQRTAELAVSVCCSSLHSERVVGTAEQDYVDAALTLLAREVAPSPLLEQLALTPAGIGLACWVEAALTTAAGATSEIRERLESALRFSMPWQDELVPHRTMDIQLALELAGLCVTPRSWADLVAESALTLRLSPLVVTEASAYALTHCAFFSTAFGTRQNSTPVASRLDDLASTLLQLMVVFVERQNWDIVGELLFSWACLGLPRATGVDCVWEVFLSQQLPTGAFPGSRRSEERIAELESADERSAERRRNPAFDFRYHTTLVALMAITVEEALQRTRHMPGASSRPLQPPDMGRSNLRHTLDKLLVKSTAKAADWAQCLLDSGSDRRRPLRGQDLAGLCFIDWLSVQAESAENSHSWRRRAQSWGSRMIDLEPSDWNATPPTLLLLTHAILSSVGVNVPFLAGYMTLAIRALSASSDVSAVGDIHVAEKRVLVEAVSGAEVGSSSCSVDAVSAAVRAAITGKAEVSSSRELWSDLAMITASHTGWGTRDARLSRELVFSSTSILAGQAAALLHGGDLSGMCRAVRSISYLSRDTFALRGLCDWLLLQQRKDGAFASFAAPAAEKLASENGIDVDLDLYLPLTVDCLWALHEGIRTDWSLYATLGAASLRPCT